MKCLLVTASETQATNLAQVLHSVADQLSVTDVVGCGAALARLQEVRFDVVLVQHDLPDLDALEFVTALRAAQDGLPVLVLGEASEAELTGPSFAVGAAAYLSVHQATPRVLLCHVLRAVEYEKLVVENRRLADAANRHQQRAQDEARRLLAEQRVLIDQAARTMSSDRERLVEVGVVGSSAALPEELETKYHDLLRSYVMAGPQQTAADIDAWADAFSLENYSSADAIQLHVRVTESLTQDLGDRSSRLILHRADVFILEVMMRIADAYRVTSRSSGSQE